MFIERVREDTDADNSLDKIIVRCVHSYTGGRSDIGYHVLDLNTGGVISSFPHTPQRTSLMGSMVAVGSLIYLFGDGYYDDEEGDGYYDDEEGDDTEGDDNEDYDEHNVDRLLFDSPYSTYFLDLINPQTGWKKAADPSTINQYLSGCVVFQGRIYVFGDSNHSSICQVFDPQHNTWSYIKSPGDCEGVKVDMPVLVDHKNKRIIVTYNNVSTMYAYYPCDDRWECLVENFTGWSARYRPITIADGVIYVHYPNFITAYDLETKRWLEVSPAPGVELDFEKSYLLYSTYNTLFHRGNGWLGLLAFAYKDCESTQTQTTVVHLVQFKVELRIIKDTKQVLVTQVYSKLYSLGSDPCPFHLLPLSLQFKHVPNSGLSVLSSLSSKLLSRVGNWFQRLEANEFYPIILPICFPPQETLNCCCFSLMLFITVQYSIYVLNSGRRLLCSVF